MLIFKCGDTVKFKASAITPTTRVRCSLTNVAVDSEFTVCEVFSRTGSCKTTFAVRLREFMDKFPKHTFDMEDLVPSDHIHAEISVGAKTEKDPSGLSASTPGAKLDAGKVMAGQILSQFPRALMAVAEVGTFGAKKYSLGGWKHVENGIARYEDAQFRHFLRRHIGEMVDPDSKLDHMAHEVWNALAKFELYLSKKEEGK